MAGRGGVRRGGGEDGSAQPEGRGPGGEAGCPPPGAGDGGLAAVEGEIAPVADIFALQGDARLRALEKAYLR